MKLNNDDEYSSSNEFYDRLILDLDLFTLEIGKMSNEEIINFYDYIEILSEAGNELKDNLSFINSTLESMPVIRMYNGSKLHVNTLLCGKSDDEDTSLSLQECEEIENTIKLLNKRRNPSFLEKLGRYFKG